MKYYIETENLKKEIKGYTILDKVNFKLEKGKIYGLLGENGSGKSTLLKILLNLYTFEGNVYVNGYNIRKKYRDVSSKISGIVDYVSLYDYLTAEENLRYFSLLYETPLSNIDNILKIVKLENNDKNVKNFSLGMKQRLGIAITLLKDPDILILDEPTNGLDPKGIKELRELIKSFKNKTIIVSSHLISEIEKVCDEILFINNKKIYQKKIEKNKNILIKAKNNNKDILYKNIDEKEIPQIVKKLVKKDISIYRIEEDTLENSILNLMEANND